MTEQRVMSTWNDVCVKYFPNRRYPDTRLIKFKYLTAVLERENIDPESYFEWTFGIMEIGMRPPNPETLTDPVRIAKYRRMNL